jgi:hypothetical protein
MKLVPDPDCEVSSEPILDLTQVDANLEAKLKAIDESLPALFDKLYGDNRKVGREDAIRYFHTCLNCKIRPDKKILAEILSAARQGRSAYNNTQRELEEMRRLWSSPQVIEAVRLRRKYPDEWREFIAQRKSAEEEEAK